jgi:CxxC motif-containing protein
MTRELTCIVCPVGCGLTVTQDDAGELHFDGFECRRGPVYAEQEVNDPRRIVTTTVSVRGGRLPRVPVKTARPVPRASLTEAVAELKRVRLTAPVQRGDVVAEDVAGTGIAAVATRTVPVRS